MELIALPALADNYIWMIHDGQAAVVVDPACADTALTALHQRGLRLDGIVVTHHHPDHIGGVTGLLRGAAAHAGTWLRAPVDPRIPDAPAPWATHRVAHGDHWTWGDRHWRTLHTPGHTTSHVCYWVSPEHPGSGAPWLLAGDTLFSAGCGRLFEGSPADLALSLSRLRDLPANTLLACAHEYTLGNLRFAQMVEPANPEIARHLAHCQGLRGLGLPTLPSTLGLEALINPFWRHREPTVVDAARRQGAASGEAADVLGTLRQWKNGAPA